MGIDIEILYYDTDEKRIKAIFDKKSKVELLY